jgi:hypothetical protein
MSRFEHTETGVVVSVDDSKDERFASGPWKSAGGGGSSDSDSDVPAGNASLEDWQDYARAQGASDDDLDGKSRNDLRDTYGK